MICSPVNGGEHVFAMSWSVVQTRIADPSAGISIDKGLSDIQAVSRNRNLRLNAASVLGVDFRSSAGFQQ